MILLGGGRSIHLFIPYVVLFLSFFIHFCSHLIIEICSNLVLDPFLTILNMLERSKSLGSHSVSKGTYSNG